MKNRYFVIIPVAAFVIILLNAFFGHMLIDLPYEQDINKYSIYVHLQEGWQSNSNIIFDVTTVWSNPNQTKSGDEYQTISNLASADVSDYNYNRLQYQRQNPYVELKHQFSDCNSSWMPILYRYAVDSVRSQIQYIQGTKLNTDPYAEVFPKYSVQRSTPLTALESFVQFIPVCTASNTATFDFSVKTNDDNVSFDVFFVPSVEEFEKFVDGNSDSFSYYPEDGCYGIGFRSFHGTCTVSQNGGLLIVLEDNLRLSLTRVTISMHET